MLKFQNHKNGKWRIRCGCATFTIVGPHVMSLMLIAEILALVLAEAARKKSIQFINKKRIKTSL